MKKILLITTACLTLNACETVETMSWPTMPSLDLFSDTQPVEDVNVPNVPTQIPTPNRAAIDTELSEMEKLTGYAPRFDHSPKQPEIIKIVDAPVTEAIEDIIKPVKKVVTTQPVEDIQIASAEPAIKPTVPKQLKPQTVAKKIQDDIQPTVEKVEKEIVNTVEPIVKKVQPEPRPIQKTPEPTMKVVEVAQPKIESPIQTIETPIFTDADLKLSSATGCPQIEIMPSARSMTYFENELSGNLLARAVINEIRGGCEITSNGMELDIDILMNGRITNKGRFEGNKDQEAFMTFPYFVSVLTPQGLPVDKKIMATAMRFRPSIDHLNHAEKITQYIPMDNTSNASNYKIVVGYQLTRKQLEYNRAQTMMRADNNRVAPDLVHRPRKSINPLAH
jgi:hypothetical protein